MTFLVNEAMVDIGLGTAGLTALLGYAVVFFGLILLMCVITFVFSVLIQLLLTRKVQRIDMVEALKYVE